LKCSPKTHCSKKKKATHSLKDNLERERLSRNLIQISIMEMMIRMMIMIQNKEENQQEQSKKEEEKLKGK
jgi:hypothetical protein